jgi:tRNA(fMet)-specific endonuclease VapC
LTSGKFLLDTNIVIALFAEDPAVKQRISETAEVFVSIIVLGELYYGALKSSRVESNLETIARFASAVPILACDSNTADEYGRIKNFLREKGRPIPENDIWIAATAQQHDLTVASRDHHFDSIDGLSNEHW